MSQAFYRVWRPALWDEVVGQDHIVQTLRNAIATDRVAHAYLFAGPKGTGKTTSARLLAKAVNCLDPDKTIQPCNKCENCLAVNQGRFMDLIEIDAASNTSVDDVRELRDKINFAPSQGKFKVYIVDEVHMLSTSAFNALLKTLEEPPAHVIFILCTTEIHKIPATVLSRCQRHEFRRIPVPTIVKKLSELTKKEKIKIEPEALSLIARQATGSMRDAISLVDQLSSMSKTITLKIAQEVLGTATSLSVIELVDAILKEDSGGGLEIIHKALDGGTDPRQYARQVVDYLRDLLVIKLQAGQDLELTPETREKMNQQAEQFEIAQLVNIISAFSEASTDLKANWHPGLGLEMALATSLYPPQPVLVTEADAPEQPKRRTRADKDEEIVYESENSGTTQKTAPKKSQSTDIEITETDPAFVPGTPLTLELAQSQWDRVKRQVGLKNRITAAVVNSGKLVQASGDTIVLNFTSELLRERMMEDKSSKLINFMLAKVYGREINLICTVGDQKVNLTPKGSKTGINLVDFAINNLNGELLENDPTQAGKEE
ncbi:MAG: DNA polymerase III subunit gamma/tau [Anaerolineaceae bacterium]|jgi:DNA polymerase-3 subunit gamma/tau|nr:DNA polymerase III subunit gamma/tau [Anaerolineaceae bacterium]MDD4042980.1 DNA polymerase III subunit gamma/tau [Anaerolineaceae bacterium]MDD4577517.1 DNA polymerase III subunit gamma/tau [Anaerolineaceae bacterium]